ncbi:protein ALP1-like [Centruroides sculpturatus]|uniref:protein ALP1-like n=1 Tax=Centruroides sculpturatus TaxID=218467 RepID=UPI000C6E7054|nr:protein ALP1-like [Centruroides sculpturatus]
MKDMKNNHSSIFRNYLRMAPSLFDKLLTLIADQLQKYSNNEPISPGECLAITLRFLATGDSYKSLAYAFYVGFSTIQKIIPETCQVIWDTLKEKYIPEPTEQIWRKSAIEFERLWQFPNCCGAVDGKHVNIQQPANSGSQFYNYKVIFKMNENFNLIKFLPGTNSIVLLGIADAHCKFLAVDVGAYGSFSDGGVLKASALGKNLKNGTLGIPSSSILPNSNTVAPHVLIDEAFQLHPDFMRPYPGRQLSPLQSVFNYRLSRARRCIECAFGILANRWRIFRRPIALAPNNTDKIIKAAVVLHNYMITENNSSDEAAYCPEGYRDYLDPNGVFCEGSWRTDELCMQWKPFK